VNECLQRHIQAHSGVFNKLFKDCGKLNAIVEYGYEKLNEMLENAL
jgi:hypothetical protein